jgi:hypothetical protein
MNHGRPDGQLCDRIFPKFLRRNLSCIRTSSGRDGSIIRTDASPLEVISITGSSRPWGRSVRTAKLQHPISISDARASGPWGGDVRTVEVESAVTIYDAPASGPQLSDVWTVHFELRFLPYRDTCPDGIPHHPDGWLIFPLLKLGKNQWTVRELIGVRTCCWNVRTEQVCTEASRYDVGVQTEETRRPDRWCLSVWCPDGMTRRPDGWISRQMGVRMADRELWNSSDFTLKSGIPVCCIITHKWFCPNTE